MINVLIAEDNVPLSVHLSNVIYFTKEVHGVSIVNNGTDVYPTIKKLRPEVVILDLKLPGEDGITILKRIEEDPELVNIKIIVYSGEPSYVQKVIGFSCVDRFINKIQQCEEVGMEVQRIAKELQDKKTSKRIDKTLSKLGFAPHHIGTRFLKECIEYAIKYDEENLNIMYEKVSLGKKQSSNTVKADVQRAVNKMWRCANKEKVRELLKLGADEKPSPKNVVPMVIYYVGK